MKQIRPRAAALVKTSKQQVSQLGSNVIEISLSKLRSASPLNKEDKRVGKKKKQPAGGVGVTAPAPRPPLVSASLVRSAPAPHSQKRVETPTTSFTSSPAFFSSFAPAPPPPPPVISSPSSSPVKPAVKRMFKAVDLFGETDTSGFSKNSAFPSPFSAPAADGFLSVPPFSVMDSPSVNHGKKNGKCVLSQENRF
jgi:hypothetical protein